MSNNISRRNFLRLSALGTSAMMIPSAANALESPLFAPAKGKKGSANDKINVGFIGLGQQAIHLMNGFITIPDVRIVAGCDIYDINMIKILFRTRNKKLLRLFKRIIK